MQLIEILLLSLTSIIFSTEGLREAETDVRRHRGRKFESKTEGEVCRCGYMMNDIGNYDEKHLIVV